MSVSASETVFAQRDSIFNTFVAEANYGGAGPGTGSNPSGRLQSIKMIRKSLFPDFASLPFLGVQWAGFTEERYGIQRRHLVTSQFDILLVASGIATGESTLDLETVATGSLEPLLNDGNGNGVLPILRLSANYTLGGNAYETQVLNTTFDWSHDLQGKGTAFITWAQIRFQCKQLIQPT